jgi:diacylglycerol kinase (ATP)
VKNALVIVNPASAGGRTGRRWPATAAALREAGLEFDSVLTKEAAHATELARDAVRSGQPLVVAAGGDGTINEVLNGFLAAGDTSASRSKLGLIPVGTGGDLRRTLAIPSDPHQAARVLLAGRSRRIDVGRAHYHRPDGTAEVSHFLNVASAGIGGEVVRRVNQGFNLGGSDLTYAVASALVLFGWKNKRMEVTIDGVRQVVVAQQVVVANCQYYGGGMRVAPQAVPDDGLFDVLIVGDLSRGECLRLLGPLRRGAHLKRAHPKLAYVKARRVEIEGAEPVRIEIDGEQPGNLPASFEILPQAIGLVAP